MINSNSTDLAVVKEMGNLVKREVNKLYKVCLFVCIYGLKSLCLYIYIFGNIIKQVCVILYYT
jgi:hypothetical protein